VIRLIIISLFWSMPLFASTPKLISLKKEFQTFARHAKDKDFETQLKFWKSDIESEIPDIYSALMKSSGDDENKYREKLATKWFPFLLKNSDKITAQFEKFEVKSWPIALQLAQKYSDVEFSDVRIVALPSLMMFDGMTIKVNGNFVALYGMDFFAMEEQNPHIIPGADLVSNSTVVVAHEFTHVLHAKVSDIGDPDKMNSLLDPLWREGLAQIHSQMLVSGTDLVNILMDRGLASRCTSSQVEAWASQFVKDSKVTSELWNKYGKWFFTNQWQALGVPRAGYCLGYHIALKALEDHSFNELIHMNRSQTDILIKKELHEIAEKP
jgi:predicted Zn-dependent protease DUF2268